MSHKSITQELGLNDQNVIANFSISFLQYLDNQGKPIRELPALAKSQEGAIALYEQMVLLRTFDTKTINLQRTGKLGTYASTLGQEAISVGIGKAMKNDDVLFPYYRDYGAQLQRNVLMEDILRYWGGDERGSNFHHQQDFPISVPIASQCLHATGAAKAIQYRKQKRAVITTCGEGGTSKGDFYEAINLAGAWCLPVVFVVNNNQWAISVPRSAQTGCKTIAQKAIAGGFEGLQVDGNDIFAVTEAVDKALQKARNGDGPTLIEAMSYRLCDHTTADDAGRYRSTNEVDTAWQNEPIKRLREFLIHQDWWNDKKEEQLQADCVNRVNHAVDIYLNTPVQEIDSIFDYMYASLPDGLARQKTYAKRFKGEHHG